MIRLIRKALITPVPAPRMTRRDKWAKRPCVVRYHAYRDLVRINFEAHSSALKAPYLLVATFAMPASWSGKKRALNRNQPHLQKPDKDNLEKAFLDALLENDSEVWAGMVAKLWGDSDSVALYSLDIDILQVLADTG